MNLIKRSIEIILDAQHPGGAYLACPNFPTYRYCWFRDGAFAAYAMNLAGQHESARRFHDWAAAAICERADVVANALHKARLGQPLAAEDILHTRYTVDGGVADEAWPNNQLDGFGAWLWALEQHHILSGEAPGSTHLQAARLAADYTAALWGQPCSDLWEEFPDRIHTYTLAAIHAGLSAATRLGAGDWAGPAAGLREYILSACTHAGHFIKSVGSEQVDASLVALAVPYGVVDIGDMRIANTIKQIEADLCQQGGAQPGVHRYATDTYYGGGQWLLLSAWLGWHHQRAGETQKAQAALRWVAGQAGANGWLAEQMPTALNDPDCYPVWRQRWGEIASPLIWSHAKYLILSHALQGQP